jgi:hypothetical protein
MNKYIWNIYKTSDIGKKSIELFEDDEIKLKELYTMLGREEIIVFNENCERIDSDEDTLEVFHKYCQNKTEAQGISDFIFDLCTNVKMPSIQNIEQAKMYFESIISGNIIIECENGMDLRLTNEPERLLSYITTISFWLYLKYPQYFKPYFFNSDKLQFRDLVKIADAFGIELPEVPLKKYKEDRFRYYWNLNLAFNKFQEENQLSDTEFCAFLYDFAPNYIKSPREPEKELPQPTQVWMCGGDKYNCGDFEWLDNYKEGEFTGWQGNVDTKRGDIIIMYCLFPRSYIHSIWRASSDGIADPFFYFYSLININNGQKIIPITLKKIKNNENFSKHQLVKRNFQGVRGYTFTSEDYKQLIDLIKQNGENVSHLPQLYSPIFKSNESLKNEREVEIEIIEPFLKELKYKESDWIRQLPVHMGRGERNFPDYAFLPDKKNTENAFMLIEAKFWIKNNKELEAAFKQVWSYGLRLSSKILIIADKNAIWIYERHNDSFDRSRYIKKYWKELENPDVFNLIKKIIGK